MKTQQNTTENNKVPPLGGGGGLTAGGILQHRLQNQSLTTAMHKTPQAVVRHLVAMQSQEYAMAKYAIGLRLPGAIHAEIEAAFNKGDILRTHVMRPTWHFIAPHDIRWMLQLTGPRVQAFNAYYYKKAELDAKILKKSISIFTRLMRDNNYATRDVIKAELEKAKITPGDTLRFTALMMNAELEGIICSGPRVGKQHTYALLEERVAPAKAKNMDEALVELTLRYFTTRGPAQLQDMAWWSGLTMKDVKTGVAALGKKLVSEIVEGKEYFYIPTALEKKASLQQSTFLMPDYDEYGICYKDRTIMTSPKKEPGYKTPSAFDHSLVVNSYLAGTWKRVEKAGTLHVDISPYYKFNIAEAAAVAKAVKRYTSFFK